MYVINLGQGHVLTLDSLSSIHTKIFFSETAWPIKVKFYEEHPWAAGMKI